MSFRAGKNSRASVQGTLLTAHQYSVTDHGEPLDTTNFESNGKKQFILGLEWCDWNLNAHWNAAQNDLDDPPGLFPRDDGSALLLYTNDVDQVFYNFPQWVCSQSHISSSVSAEVEFDCSGSSNGDYDRPAGNA